MQSRAGSWLTSQQEGRVRVIAVVAQSFTDSRVFVYTGFADEREAQEWVSSRIDAIRFTYTIVRTREAAK
jgi:hypothetical protein